ncbi:amino acid ABC transporter permease [Haloarcula sp. 1CSR25-25]|uniref:amino acid ABC transporter permease n=1 Tax=Haloarcula sp. 1CSR25-25 TaxID=2862545 RepID=UPI00289428E4|nr:amino acid ABC transporter permease [Haloarcula sp. 1CSR25-25]MDT3436260.1 amino acid ABC transporter permease [Haloarcula sp. 1CSR25-25]
MGTPESTTTGRTIRARAAGLTDQPLALLTVAVFWTWLVVRWTNDFLLDGALIERDTSFFPTAPFEAVAATLGGIASNLGPVGVPVGWVAGFFEFLAASIPYLPPLATGVWATVLLTVLGIALGFVIAVPLSVARVYGGSATRSVALGYTELFRGTPLLAQLFVLYFATPLTAYIRELPTVGAGFIPAQAFWVAVIAFTLNSAAYQSEYIRSALNSVPEGQLTAARSIGLSKVGGIRHVVLPQGLRYAIPGWSNELVYLIKYSSLASFITVRELFERTDAIASETYRYTELFVLAGLLYLALVISASLLMEYVEGRVAIPGLGTTGR